jgi:peptidoglycan/LPS O-acetylase OafA/YrhL
MLYFLMAPFIYLALKKMLGYLQGWIVFCVLSLVFFCVAFSVFYALPAESGAFTVSRRSWSLLARFDFTYNLMAFVLGGASVFIVKDKNYIKVFAANRVLVKAATCILAILVTAYSSTSGLTQLNSGYLSYFIAFGLIPSVALIVLGVAILNETQSGSTGACSRYFVYLGLLSYGVYLFHMPIFDVVQKYALLLNIQMANESTTLLVLCITVLLSHVTYKYIELPFLRRR